ncbi:MAG: cob(I)yrinic acid a,c-diamide adenosyltransferase [Gemmatimonadota bacterium]
MSAPRIYTRRGDRGETGLFGSDRVPKDDQRVVAYGMVDELSAFIGWAVAADCGADLNDRLQTIQQRLFDIGADLATPHGTAFRERLARLVDEHDVQKLEHWIDACTERTPELRAFVLPGGSEAGARLHIARCVCRNAERACVSLARGEEMRAEILAYLNRLSDFLFAAARLANHERGVPDIAWQQEG